jgi:hypothetical protein
MRRCRTICLVVGESAEKREHPVRRAVRWLGPTQPATKSERAFQVFGVVAGLVLIVASGLDGWFTAVGVGLISGCVAGLATKRGFRPKPRKPPTS